MQNIYKLGLDGLLLQLEEKIFIDQRFKFVKENGGLKLLGIGGFSYVYEMYDSMAPENHYAAKIIGLGDKTINEELVKETTEIQHFLSEQCDNITRIIALWIMKVQLDDAGNIIDITKKNQNDYENAVGIPLEIILMEKLDCIISKGKYGKVELLRDELKTEKGVVRLAQDIGNALVTVHNNSFLHRDIKLENIFWDPKSDRYKLGDFGIAKYVGNSDAETVVFTNGYGAPEIERKLEESYKLTADIYSFGITLFLLLNNLTFPTSDGYCAQPAQYSKDFVLPAPINGSEKMAKIIRKMCSYRAIDRYQTAEDILLDISKTDDIHTTQKSMEYSALETETYRDPILCENGKHRDSTDGKSHVSFEHRIKLSREEKIKIIRQEKARFDSVNFGMMLLLSLCTFLLLNAFSSKVSYVGRGEFLFLPITLFIEAVFQRRKMFGIGFGLVVIGLASFLIYSFGVDIPQIFAVVVVIMGIPAILVGFSIGLCLWTIQQLTERLLWLRILNRWDLGWFFIVIFVVIINGFVLLREKFRKSNKHEWIVIRFSIISGPVLIISGIILLLLRHFDLVAIPELIREMHFIRTGIGIIVGLYIMARQYRESD